MMTIASQMIKLGRSNGTSHLHRAVLLFTCMQAVPCRTCVAAAQSMQYHLLSSQLHLGLLSSNRASGGSTGAHCMRS